MTRTALRLGAAFVAITLTGCSETSFGPNRTGSLGAPVADPVATTSRAPDLAACPRLGVPAGNQLVLRLFARGVQIYRWDGASWIFVAPDAALFADRTEQAKFGRHYAGPTWESISGSKAVGTVEERCTADATAIQWLRLRAVSATGPGAFTGITYIQRVNTAGGLAPAQRGAVPGDEAKVPYTTEYLFYRGE